MTIASLRSIHRLAALVVLGAFAAVAHAGPQCTTQPRTAWQDADKFQSELKSQGYRIDRFKITSGQCYEIYGRDKAGKKVEIYFDPVSGQIVKQESR
jgi:hypothetical protein